MEQKDLDNGENISSQYVNSDMKIWIHTTNKG